MFPLGQVLFPSLLLPLRVFEPRYRQLFAKIIEAPASDPRAGEFGVALIERGSEVGGGDVRSNIGTVARVIRAEASPDGRWGILAVGIRRIRVDAWLPDDPWPRAVIRDWRDPDTSVDASALTTTTNEVRHLLGLAAQLGDPAPEPSFELVDDPVVASFQLAALAPFGPFDQQRFLAAHSATERLSLIREAVAEQVEVYQARLRLDDQ